MKKVWMVCLLLSSSVFAADKNLEVLERLNATIKENPKNFRAYQARGETHFRLGHFKASVEDFDKVIANDPKSEPYHWQRGISHFYAGMYEAGVKQFEVHRTVNPNDVENSVWHFLCLSKVKSVEEARKQFIPTAGDARIPMMQIHALFAGKMTAEEVLKKVENGARRDLFYAHLYLGLYYHVLNKPDLERKHIGLATTKHGMPGYMGDTARAHMIWLKEKEKSSKD